MFCFVLTFLCSFWDQEVQKVQMLLFGYSITQVPKMDLIELVLFSLALFPCISDFFCIFFMSHFGESLIASLMRTLNRMRNEIIMMMTVTIDGGTHGDVAEAKLLDADRAVTFFWMFGLFLTSVKPVVAAVRD